MTLRICGKKLPSSDPHRNTARTQYPYIRDRVPFGVISVAKGRKCLVRPEIRDAHRAKRAAEASKPAPPAIQNLLKRAYELRYRLTKTPGLTRFALAREIDMDPAHLTRFLNLTGLAPRIQRYILALPPTTHHPLIKDREWHALARIRDPDQQLRQFESLLRSKPIRQPIPEPVYA